MSTKIRDLITQMTLEEKAALVTGLNAWQTTPIERLEIPSITMSDGPHGVRRAETMTDKALPATGFPTASALAATWDPGLIYEMGQALAEEAIARGVDILLGPGNNMKRTPLCGRNFEYFSEDPFLGGELAAALIQGLQSKGVGASLKHFAANNQETDRMVVSAEIDERTFREIYLAGFERAVKKAQPWTVMCSYNRINGTHASENARLLREILVEEWGFEGFVVSDWGAVHERVRTLAAGLHLEMPGPHPRRTERVVQAVQSGKLDEAALDAAVERILKIVFQACNTPKGGTEIEIDAHHELAHRVASQAIVLLKNDGDLLPLKDVNRLAVIGLAAKTPFFQGLGSSQVTPTRVDIPFDKIQEQAPGAELAYAPGYTMEAGFDQALIDRAVQAAAGTQAALIFIALPPFKEAEGLDRPDMELSRQQVALIQAVSAVQPRCAVILNTGSAVDMRAWIDGVQAVLQAGLTGQAGGAAIADVIFGRTNPSGHLAETFPLKLSDTPARLNFPGQNGQVRYGEGLYIGYRYYDEKEMEVLFPFGHGLSYTTFELAGLHLSAGSIREGEPLVARVEVTNTGEMAGKALVQIYVHDPHASLPRPYKELKGFARVDLQPGETQTVEVELDERAFAYYHPGFERWVIESGEFEILAGQSAAGPFLRQAVKVESARPLPMILTMDSTLGDWLAHPQGAGLLQEQLLPLFAQFQSETGGEVSILEAVEWAKALPLETVISFWAKNLPKPPEELVQDMLAKVR